METHTKFNTKCVVVTCYYKLPHSKHTHQSYEVWMKNMLENLLCPIVIFVGDRNTFENVSRMRVNFPSAMTEVIVLPLPNLRMEMYMNNWKYQWKNMDPEQNIHNPSLYILWNEKIEFMTKAKSVYSKKDLVSQPLWYMWMDIGSFRCRQSELQSHEIREWLKDELLEQRLSKTKFNMLQVGNFEEHDRILQPNGITVADFSRKLASVGGTFVIPAASIQLWNERYYLLLLKYLQNNRFAGKDQNVLSNMLMLYPKDIHVLSAKKSEACVGDYDPWFYFHAFLHPKYPKPVWVSVLIPLYTKDIHFLKDSLKSVLSQSYPMYNCLVGVNGDKSQKEIVMKKINCIVKELTSNNNLELKVSIEWFDTKGKVDTMNAMVLSDTVQIPEGLDYNHRIAILDADDMWLAFKIGLQVCAINIFNDKYDVIGGLCEYFDNAQGIPKIPAGDVTKHDFFAVNPIINSSVLIRKEDALWSDSFKGLDDYDMWMRLKYEKGRTFYNIGKIITKHRVHNKSAFNASGVQDINIFKRICRQKYNLL